jgi:predicted nucleic acid-binding protein
VLTLDTSALFALVNRKDPAHKAVKQALLADTGPYLVSAGILAEIGYLVEERLGAKVLCAFLADLDDGLFAYSGDEERLRRIRELVAKYADLPLGFADAAVIACAERHGGRVATLDRRDFSVVAQDVELTLLP